MQQSPPGPARGPGPEWIQHRVESKGFRPRFAAYLVIASWSLAIIIFAVVERIVDPGTFDSIWDSLWWATQTVTTVGYGDIVPEGTAGKGVAALLMLGGLGFLAVLTGVITSAFVMRAQTEHRASGEDPVSAQIERLTTQVESLRDEIAALRSEPKR